MDRRLAVLATLLCEAGLLAVTLVGLILWLLLSRLGDEQGALAARFVATGAGVATALFQILLLNLLALAVLRDKIDHSS